MSDPSWSFLLVGSFAAVGAAMALGTLAALLRYRRTGEFPGAEAGETVPRGRLIALWSRVGVGSVLAAIGVVVLQRNGLI
ncbi:hypothetical protein [Egicoccus halophilus]|uniref:Uncharacterized protein n=1 Tax=Egicoccus halophilus TaxID=1670830 RepID=A0A8J3ESM2_9ACTN|nr:hypothetical protein [Egicoccus halophilus]GGI03291.1 hypothetical protein GCM10011354_03300 [Egicoccus halophilus]